MNPLRALFNFIRRLFPNWNRAQRRRYFHEQKRKGFRGQTLLRRYHLLWVKRSHSSGWWYRARRCGAAA